MIERRRREKKENSDGGSSKRTCFTFREFRTTHKAYMQMPLLWRNDIYCKGFKGPIGDIIWNDLRSELINFKLLAQLRVEPTVFSPFRVLQLFVSHADHLSYLHFDEQPNLFLQISGRKRWLLFPPDIDLKPYGPESRRARRSSVDVFSDAADHLRGKGFEVLLNPGDVLFVPSYWWHHVQSVTEECISIAIWFFNQQLPLLPSSRFPTPLKLTQRQVLAQRRYQNSDIV